MRYLPHIAVAVMVIAIGVAVYEHFFSDKAELIRLLEAQIEQQEERIGALTTAYQQLEEEDQERLQEIETLRARLDTLQTKIAQGEATIEAINQEVNDIDTALDIISEHTRDALASSRGLLEPAGMGAGGARGDTARD